MPLVTGVTFDVSYSVDPRRQLPRQFPPQPEAQALLACVVAKIDGGRPVLIVGGAGSGKSTLAITALRQICRSPVIYMRRHECPERTHGGLNSATTTVVEVEPESTLRRRIGTVSGGVVAVDELPTCDAGTRGGPHYCFQTIDEILVDAWNAGAGSATTVVTAQDPWASLADLQNCHLTLLRTADVCHIENHFDEQNPARGVIRRTYRYWENKP